jgi:hypothetical protein
MSGNPPAGYYADPSIPGYIRYWDGAVWVAGTSRPAPQEAGGGEAAGPADARRDVVEDVLAASSGATDAWRPEPTGGAAAQQAAQQAYQAQEAEALRVEAQRVASQQFEAQQAVPQQFAQQPFGHQQAESAAAQQFGQQQAVPQQFAQQYPQPAPQQYQQPVPQAPRIPQQYQPAPQQPGYAEPASIAPQRVESVAEMVVPSAFAARNATGTYGYGGQANPFAGLPGSPAGVPQEAEGEIETTVLELATPGSRFLARIIDLGISAVFSAPITVSLLLVAHRHDHEYVLGLDAQATTTYTTLGMDAVGIALWAGALVALVLVAIVYEGYRLGRGGQTAGKRLAGIRVVRLADANPVRGAGTGIRRALLFWVLAVLPVIDLLALGGVLWGRPYRQGLHERVTATATVKAEAG